MTDIQEQFKDYEFCPICKRDILDNQIKTVVVQKETVYRVCSMCNDCYRQCESNKDYGEYIANYVFKNKIGRVWRIEKR